MTFKVTDRNSYKKV